MDKKEKIKKSCKRISEKINQLSIKTVLLIFFSFQFSMVYSQNQIAKIPGLQKDDIEVIAEAFNLWKTKGEQVWEDWTKINIPFIYRKRNYEYWINFPSSIPEKVMLDISPRLEFLNEQG